MVWAVAPIANPAKIAVAHSTDRRAIRRTGLFWTVCKIDLRLDRTTEARLKPDTCWSAVKKRSQFGSIEAQPVSATRAAVGFHRTDAGKPHLDFMSIMVHLRREH